MATKKYSKKEILTHIKIGEDGAERYDVRALHINLANTKLLFNQQKSKKYWK